MSQLISVIGIAIFGYLWLMFYSSEFASGYQSLMLLASILTAAVPTASR